MAPGVMCARFCLLIVLVMGGRSSVANAQTRLTAAPVWPRTWVLPSGVTCQLRGRIDTDAIWCSQSEKNEADFGHLGNAVGLRRARIGIQGDLPDSGSYVAEIDLASGAVVIRDVFFATPSCFGGQTHVGHFREPFSLEGGTSARFFAFLERSPANVLDPARNWGLGLFDVQPNDNSTLAVGMFYSGSDSNDFEGGEGSTADVTAKFTAAPINEQGGRYLLHMGAALSERLPLDNAIIINQKPRSPLLELGDSSTSPFTPTLMIPAGFQQVLNTQLAVAHGSLWAQAEWYGTIIEQTGGGTIFYQGSYVDVGWFLTGEHREYETARGFFGPVRVQRPLFSSPGLCGCASGPGAWELTARIAWVDFFDPDAPLGSGGQLQGVQLTQATFGVNWYLTDRLRLMFNYSYVEPSEPNLGQSSARIFASRLAYFW